MTEKKSINKIGEVSRNLSKQLCLSKSFQFGAKYTEAMKDIEQLDFANEENFETLRYNAGKSFMDLLYAIDDYKNTCDQKIDKEPIKQFGNLLKNIKNKNDIKSSSLNKEWEKLSKRILPK